MSLQFAEFIFYRVVLHSIKTHLSASLLSFSLSSLSAALFQNSIRNDGITFYTDNFKSPRRARTGIRHPCKIIVKVYGLLN